MSLRRRLSILVAVGLTPPFLLTVFNAARWQLYMEKDSRSDAVADARLASTEIGQMIDNGRQLLVTLSRYPVMATNEKDCVAYFKTVLAELPIYRAAAVVDKEGKFHCSTIPIPPDLDVKDRLYFRGPLATGNFTVGGLTTGRVTGSSSIHISMPYQSPDRSLSGIIVAIVNPDKMIASLAAVPWNARDHVILLDHDGSLVASIPASLTSDADVIARAVFPKLSPQSAAAVETDALKDRPQIVGFAPLGERGGGLSVLVAVDRTVAMADVRNMTARDLTIGLLTIMLGIGGVWLATHFSIIRPVRKMVQIARRREGGDTSVRFPEINQMTELGELSSALSRMSDKVDVLLGQKVLLLRELQHRIMNSLNLLSSSFDIQGRQHQSTDKTREQLASARNRIVALGTVYRYLYNTDPVDDIEISELMRAMCREMENAYEGPVSLKIEVNAEPLLLSGTNAISLAMLTHELITNAIKHAYSEGEPGPISVSLKRIFENGFEYRFADRGRGLPGDFQFGNSESFGMIMIAATTRQLDGKLEINQLDPGTEIVLQLPPEIEQSKAA